MSSSSSATTSTLLASLEARRQNKRRQVESLFVQQQALQKQMEALENELLALDDEIQDLQDEQQQEEQATTTTSTRMQSGQATRQHSEKQQDDNNDDYDEVILTTADDVLPPPPSLTYSDEFLSDPTTQQQQQHLEESWKVTAATTTATERSTSRSSSSIGSGGGGMGQLDLVRTTVSTTTTTKKRSSVATAAGRSRPTTAAGNSQHNNKTLDQYFGAAASTSHQQEHSQEHTRMSSSSAYYDQRQQEEDDSFHAAAVAPPTTQTSTSSSNVLSSRVQQLLHHTFGLSSFRGHQEDIIHATLAGHDVFVIMRTGGGKSLCYQLPAVLEGRRRRQGKLTLVVSPLLSLIQDQEEQMNAFVPGSAISLHGNLSRDEQARRWDLIRNPESGVCLLLVTPEKVHKSNKLRRELQSLFHCNRLGRFVVDEAHCCSNWGHDFRPDYTKLGMLKTHFPTIPLLAVTATASDRVRQDVCQILRLGNHYQFFRSTARRPNLHYSVLRKTPKVVEDMADFIQQHHAGHAGIIYTMTKKEADQVATKLSELDIVAKSYHSSVTPAQKERIHKSWMNGRTQVVVATIAFGLGINKPDVRFVLHHTLSKSLEAYYQESGRAGRDGGPADCLLYYSPKDVPRIITMIHGDNGEQAFWTMARYAQASGSDAVCKAIILKSLGEPDCPNVPELLSADDGVVTEEKYVSVHAKTVTALLNHKIQRGEDLTLAMLVKEWRSKNPADCVKDNPPGKEFTEDECQRIVVSLILENIISPNVIWNSYGNTMYLKLGSNGERFLAAENPTTKIRLPIKPPKAANKTTATKSSSSSTTKKKAATTTRKKAETDKDGWIQATRKKRKSSEMKPKKGCKVSKKSKAKPKREEQAKPDVIELLDDSSSSDENEEPIVNENAEKEMSSDDCDEEVESDSEFEF